MKKKVLVLTLVLLVSIVSVVFAASINGDYKGNPIVNVLVNGIKLTGLDVPAIIYDGRTLLPLRACVENVNGIVEWDAETQTAIVIKPETSIYFIVYSNDGKAIPDVYSDIPILGQGMKYYAVIDIGGIAKGIYNVKWDLMNQNGAVMNYSDNLRLDIEEDNSITKLTSQCDSIKIEPGVYKFKLYMQDSEGIYKTIAVKTFKYVEAMPLSEQPDINTYNEYFSEFYLGKLPAGQSAGPLNIPTRTSDFTSSDQFCTIFTVKKEIPAGKLANAVYDVNAKKNFNDKAPYPMPMGLQTGNFMGSGQLAYPVGKYEYKIYIDDKLAVVLPFEVK